MNCFECAKTNDTVPAVGVCPHCGVGLCLDHLIEAREYRVGGTFFGCPHASRAEAAARHAGRDRCRRPPPHRRRLVTAPAANLGQRRRPELALLAKALGHPARVHILRLLLSRDACYCGQLVDELPLAQATVSQHLKVLKDAGLIVGEIEGLRTCYCASRERLGRAARTRRRACSPRRSRWTPMAATETVRRPATRAAGRRRRGGAEEALDARPLPAALDRARDGRRARARLADPDASTTASTSCASAPSRCRSRSGCC